VDDEKVVADLKPVQIRAMRKLYVPQPLTKTQEKQMSGLHDLFTSDFDST